MSFEEVKDTRLEKQTDDHFNDQLEWGGNMVSNKIPEPEDNNFSIKFQESNLCDHISLAVAIVDYHHKICYINNAFCEIVRQHTDLDTILDFKGANLLPFSSLKELLLKQDFYRILGNPDIIGPDYCPFHTVQTTHEMTETSFIVDQITYDMKIVPKYKSDQAYQDYYFIELSNAMKLVDIEQRLKRLQEIERSLMDMSTKEIETMTKTERRNLFISRVETYFKELFGYNIYEFRILNRLTGELEPLLSNGLSNEAATRRLFANPSEFGITGFVAYFGKPYLCEDPFSDPLYLRASDISRRSYTLPLKYQNEIIGTCNVESERLDAFSDRELYLLQFFVAGIANTLHTQELLDHENQKGSIESVLKIQMNLAEIIDEIRSRTCALTDAQLLFLQLLKEQRNLLNIELSGIQDAYLEPTTVRQILLANICSFIEEINKMGIPLNGILQASGELQTAIGKERDRLEQFQQTIDNSVKEHPRLHGKHVLVVDKLDEIRTNAHRFFEQYGCIVDTAKDTLDAICLIKRVRYDLIISQIYPDGGMNGEQFFMRLCDLYKSSTIPLLLASDLGVHDSGHMVKNSMIKGLIGNVCRQQYYPKQILPLFEKILNVCGNLNIVSEYRETNSNGMTQTQDELFGYTISQSEPATHVKGFHLHNKSRRFDQWVAQITNSASSDGDLPLSPSGTLDAT